MSDFVQLQVSLSKPVVSAAVHYAIDTMYFKSPSERALPYAAAVGVGVYAASIVGNFVPDLSFGLFPNGKSVESRILEIGLGTTSAWAMNKYYIGNDFGRQDMMMRLGAIAISDFAGEYASDYMSGRPLAIFS